VAGIYSGGFKTRLETSPPPPNSIIAQWAHLGWRWPHPNPYLDALKLASSTDPARSLSLPWILINLAALTSATFVATQGLVGWGLERHGVVRNALYGWLAEATAVEGAIGYVVTNLELDGAAIGYEGILDYVTLDSSKQVVSLVLSDCELFTLVAKGGLVHRVANPREAPLQNIVLHREVIRNMAFTPIGIAD
jgi:hypothetical protein